MAQWQARAWPGNVRELRNFADRLVLGVADGMAGGVADSASAVQEAGSLPQQVDAFEKMLIADALAGSDGNVAAAADRMGVPKKTLYDKIRKYQLSTSRIAEG